MHLSQKSHPFHILRVGELRWRAKAQRDLPDAPVRPTACGGLRFASNPPYARKLAAVALANKMARIVWAMMTSGEAYRQPATV